MSQLTQQERDIGAGTHEPSSRVLSQRLARQTEAIAGDEVEGRSETAQQYHRSRWRLLRNATGVNYRLRWNNHGCLQKVRYSALIEFTLGSSVVVI